MEDKSPDTVALGIGQQFAKRQVGRLNKTTWGNSIVP
jgi:hypothetical protein